MNFIRSKLEVNTLREIPSNFKIYSLLLIASALPFFIYGEKLISSPYNTYQFFEPHLFLTTWTRENFGSFSFFLIPYDMLIWILMRIFSEARAVQLSSALLLFIALSSSYNLIKHLFSDERIGVIGSFLYSYSIYGQFMSGWPIHSGSGVFALAPYFAYKFFSIKKGDSVFYNSTKMGLLTIFFINVNMTFLIYLFGLLAGIIIFRYFCDSKHHFQTLISTFFLTGFFYLLINSPFIVVFLSSFIVKSNIVSVSLSAESATWKSSTSYLHELIREMGALNFSFSFKNIIAYPNAQIFISNIFFIASSFLISLLVYASFLLDSRKNYFERMKVFFLIVLIVSFFFGMGVFPLSPTRGIYTFLGNTVPFFAIFRDSYKIMFVVNMVYAMLLSYTLYFYKVKKNKKYNLISLILVGLIFLNSFQFWSGNFLNHQLINIPNEWYKVHDSGIIVPNSLTIYMPKSSFPVYTFTAQRGVSTFFYRPLFNYSVVNAYDIVTSPESSTIAMLYNSNASPFISSLYGFYGINSVLLQKDVDWEYYEGQNPTLLQKSLDKNLPYKSVY